MPWALAYRAALHDTDSSQTALGLKHSGGRVADSDTGPAKDAPVVIKKYANRRLYNTSSSAYVTLDDLSTMVREGVDFVVFDARTNDDLTRQVLTQIIVEEESRGESLLPVQFLRQLIGFYGGQMQGVLPSYLAMSLDSFSRQQDQMRGQMQKAFGATPGVSLFDEQVRQNMAMFQRAMKVWSPFVAGGSDGVDDAPPAQEAPSSPAPASRATDPLEEMRRQMAEMQAQLARLAMPPGKS
jgi:polyhydroxyalkanoate synthesis repressor PhaR